MKERDENGRVVRVEDVCLTGRKEEIVETCLIETNIRWWCFATERYASVECQVEVSSPPPTTVSHWIV